MTTTTTTAPPNLVASSSSSSSTLVNVADDAELRLVALLAGGAADDQSASSSTFQEKCHGCIEAGDAARLVQIILQSKTAMQALVTADESVAAVSLLAALLQKKQTNENNNNKRSSNKDDDSVLALADAILAAPSTSDDDMMLERKLSLVAVLYNMLPPRCALLTRMIAAAGGEQSSSSKKLMAPDTVLGGLLEVNSSSSSDNSKQQQQQQQQQPRIVELLDAWDVSVAEKRHLYSTIVRVSSSSKCYAARKQRFLLLLVETYTSTSTVDAAGLAAAKEAAIGAIRDPVTLFHHQRNLLSRPAIQALQKDSGDSSGNGDALFRLLVVFQEGKLQDYENLIAQQQRGDETSFLSQWDGLDAETCQRYMRILSLCSLASEHEEIPYAVIAETLKLQAGVADVESWVIAAVHSGLLQAKMDQLAQKVMVERCVVRKFDMEQWKNLQSRLTAWKDNVGSILAALKQSQATNTAAAASSSSN